MKITIPLHWQDSYKGLNAREQNKVDRLLGRANSLNAELELLSANAPIGQRSKVWQRKQALWQRLDNQVQRILGIL